MSKKRKSRPRRRRRTPKAAYPSPAERERIIERREELLEKLVTVFVTHPDEPHRVDRLIREYGPQEVAFVLNILQHRRHATFIGDETAVYREYRRTFARFGGNRPFLDRQEYGELSFEHAKLHATRKFKSVFPRRPSHRERELNDLLLSGVRLWEDITPPAVPPRPDDFDTPAPGEYGYPARTLLTWGWDVDERRVADRAKNVAKWHPAVPDLLRMVFDEGLLNGWPGEASGWAPYHALHMLGYLRTHEAAGQLLALLDQENDWLSDKLPAVWGQMGPQAESPLWDYVDDSRHDPEKRSIVFMGLAAIAEGHPERRLDIVDGLAHLLQCASADDAEANAYIVHVLDRMQAVEATEVIIEAFEQGKVDASIVQPYDVTLLQDWEDLEDWEE